MGVNIKICGITRVEDALACVDLEVESIGLNFVPGSPRQISEERAREISEAVDHRVEVVGVVANYGDGRALHKLMVRAQLHRLQLHGDESASTLRYLYPFAYKAVRVADASDIARADAYSGYLLIDAKVDGALGGTGKRVDTALVAPLAARRRIMLAGGLDPSNVADVIRAVRPNGVDVASGVETSPGVKDPDALRAFVKAAREA